MTDNGESRWWRAGFFVLALALACTAQAEDHPKTPCYKLDEYEQVLDAYFAHAYSMSSSATIVRIYGGLAPEYEIVLDPIRYPNAVVRYTPAKSIWGNIYSLAKPHLSLNQYVEQAQQVPVNKVEYPLPEERMKALLETAGGIDMNVCEQMPMKDHSGHAVIVLDAPWYEVLQKQRTIRVRVTSSREVVTRNPRLMDLGQMLERAYGVPVGWHNSNSAPSSAIDPPVTLRCYNQKLLSCLRSA